MSVRGPGFSRTSTIFATAKRKTQAAMRAVRESMLHDSLSGYALLFEPILASDFLQRINPTKRERAYGCIPTFWAWLGQILEFNTSCSKAVSMVQTWNIALVLSLHLPATQTLTAKPA